MSEKESDIEKVADEIANKAEEALLDIGLQGRTHRAPAREDRGSMKLETMLSALRKCERKIVLLEDIEGSLEFECECQKTHPDSLGPLYYQEWKEALERLKKYQCLADKLEARMLREFEKKQNKAFDLGFYYGRLSVGGCDL